MRKNIDSNIKIIRSLSNVQIVNKNDYTDLYNNFKANLYILSENYGELLLEKFILFYNICHDESIIKKSIITLNKKPSQWNKTESEVNKKVLNIKFKNLSNTTDLKQWGELNILFVNDYI